MYDQFEAPNDFRGYVLHSYEQNSLSHHGILGMHWGIRRFQNKDGSLTSAGKIRYGSTDKESYKGYLKKETKKYEEDIKKVLKKKEFDYKVQIVYDDNAKGLEPERLQKFIDNSLELRRSIAKILDSEIWNEAANKACSNMKLSNNDKVEYIARSIGNNTNKLYVDDYGDISWEIDDGIINFNGGTNLVVALDDTLTHIMRVER